MKSIAATLAPSVEESLKELCSRHGVYLLEVVLRGTEQRRIVEIYVDSPQGVTLDQCGVLSKEMDAIFERDNAFSAAYRLEVSSPGTDRPLQYIWQYERNVGRLLSVELTDGKTAKGRIGSVQNGIVTIEPSKSRQKPPTKKTLAAENILELPAALDVKQIRSAVVEVEF